MTDNIEEPKASELGAAAAAAYIAKEAARLYKEWEKNHKRARVLIVGKTGVGKSTLINTVFRDNIATTGIGRPVTQKIEEITKAGVPISILDTKGLELGDYESIKDSILDEIKTRQGEDAEAYVHVAWLCISEDSARIEDAEINLAKSLQQMGLKVIIVITKASRFKDNAFEKEVREQFSSITSNVLLTRALAEDLYDDEDKVIGRSEVRGMNELLDLTYFYLPESQRYAFTNATSIKHKKSIELKKNEADKAILYFCGAAGLVGATPIPFSDAIALVPIQAAMIIKISQVFGMNVTQEAALPIVTSLVGAAGASMVGRAIVSGLFKLLPGIGSVIGGVISATTASTLTKSLGSLYAGTLSDIANRGEPLEIGSALTAVRRQMGV